MDRVCKSESASSVVLLAEDTALELLWSITAADFVVELLVELGELVQGAPCRGRLISINESLVTLFLYSLPNITDSLLEDNDDEEDDNGGEDMSPDPTAEEIEVKEGEDSHWFFLAPRGNVPGWPEVPVGGGPNGPMGYSIPVEVIIASEIK